MKGYVQAFIILSITYLVIGTGLGVLFFVNPELQAFRLVHMHLNLLGFLTMMVFGVLYHVLPRFIGHPLHSEKWAWIHLYAGNAAFVVLVLSMAASIGNWFSGAWVVAGWAGFIEWCTILLFASNIFITIRNARIKSVK
ncbi:hypothetical protein [Brevibacillus sp. SYSU BS000544]|uniref:hypothetical protein n=1 Tax=Brevibacillus sp. SYSU BS000544 TaxID=3416443 RepID=UPI003CE51F16